MLEEDAANNSVISHEITNEKNKMRTPMQDDNDDVLSTSSNDLNNETLLDESSRFGKPKRSIDEDIEEKNREIENLNQLVSLLFVVNF